ncbi:hypothetical protein HK104_011318, partial [Borealophlyctis nickersoniae]
MSEPFIIHSSALQKYNQIGEGGFGVVRKGLWCAVTVAVKELKDQTLTERERQEFLQEARTNHELPRHPNILAFFGIVNEPGQYAMVMEYMPNGSLFDYIESGKSLDWPARRKIARDIACGMMCLHGANVFHCDLKALNVLLAGDGTAKVADFGLSRVHSNLAVKDYILANGGTVLWRAPELMQSESLAPKFTRECDVYSYAITLTELFTFKGPYGLKIDEIHLASVVQIVKAGGREPLPGDIPPRLQDLVKACWAQEPQLRPSFSEIIGRIDDIEKKEKAASLLDSPRANLCFTPPAFSPWLKEKKKEDIPVVVERVDSGFDEPNRANLRTWFDKTGVFSFEARFLKEEEGLAEFIKLDGTKTCVPLEWLDTASVESVRTHIRSSAGSPTLTVDSLADELANLGVRDPLPRLPMDLKEAFNFFSKAAEKGNLEGMYMLAACYYDGYGVQQDRQKGKQLFIKAADHGHSGSLGMCFLHGFGGRRKDLDESHRHFCTHAEQGNFLSQLEVARYHIQKSEDLVLAVEWIGKAEASGDMRVHLYWGELYGLSNSEAALESYRIGAAAGDLRAEFAIGEMYWLGKGVHQDLSQALVHFRNSSTYCESQLILGNAHHWGAGVECDLMEAERWYKLAARQGSATAMFQLAKMYYVSSKTVAAKYQKAVKWCKRAAEEGSVEAQDALAGKGSGPMSGFHLPPVASNGENGSDG